jgi:hypothetical protein
MPTRQAQRLARRARSIFKGKRTDSTLNKVLWYQRWRCRHLPADGKFSGGLCIQKQSIAVVRTYTHRYTFCAEKRQRKKPDPQSDSDDEDEEVESEVKVESEEEEKTVESFPSQRRRNRCSAFPSCKIRYIGSRPLSLQCGRSS